MVTDYFQLKQKAGQEGKNNTKNTYNFSGSSEPGIHSECERFYSHLVEPGKNHMM
jgi:hypothetical protein